MELKELSICIEYFNKDKKFKNIKNNVFRAFYYDKTLYYNSFFRNMNYEYTELLNDMIYKTMYDMDSLKVDNYSKKFIKPLKKEYNVYNSNMDIRISIKIVDNINKEYIDAF